jgi:hypothetical protein
MGMRDPGRSGVNIAGSSVLIQQQRRNGKPERRHSHHQRINPEQSARNGSITCNLTPITTQYGFSSEWSCTGGSFSLKSTNGAITLTGVITAGVFTLIQTEKNRINSYNYALYANVSASQTIKGNTVAVVGAVMETLTTLNSPLNPGTGTIETGLIDTCAAI